jgi:signal transduction histidine kinase
METNREPGIRGAAADRADVESAALREAYRAETVAVLWQRLGVAVVVFAVFMGLGTVLEVLRHPERQPWTVVFYLTEVLTCVAVLGISRLASRPWCLGVIGGSLVGGVAVQILGYHAFVGAQAERVALVLVCVLNLSGVLLPWGTGPQVVAAVLAVGSFGIGLPYLAVADDIRAAPLVALASGATASICAAFFLARYRYEVFRRSVLQAEAVEIAETLVDVGEKLSANLDQPDMLESVNHLVLEKLRYEWSGIWLLDERRRAFRLAANVGARPEVRSEMEQLEFPPGSIPLFAALQPGELVEIQDSSAGTLIPADLMLRLEAASALCAPIARGERIIGILISGYHQRRGPFPHRQQRLMMGIAHAAAIAIENARLIADLQAASRLKSEFVATMSHELRTPLNVIMGYGEMLADRLIEPYSDAWMDSIERIQRNAAELTSLINATLDIGRLESGREEVVVAPFDLDRLLAEVQREVDALIPPGVVLTCRNAAGAGSVMTDRVKVKTILKNLVGNALKFTLAGSVDVGAALDEGSLVIEVCDTGIGIAPENVSIIFDMFRQVDGSATRRYGGVGLGLHIVKRLVGLLGGTVAVESTEGSGSRFTVTLPRAGVVVPTAPDGEERTRANGRA